VKIDAAVAIPDSREPRAKNKPKCICGRGSAWTQLAGGACITPQTPQLGRSAPVSLTAILYKVFESIIKQNVGSS